MRLAALFSRPNAIVGGVLLLVMLVAAIVGHIYTPYDPIANDLTARLKAPSAAHWLGTDEWGRDVLSRLLYGAGVSMSISSFRAGTCSATTFHPASSTASPQAVSTAGPTPMATTCPTPISAPATRPRSPRRCRRSTRFALAP